MVFNNFMHARAVSDYIAMTTNSINMQKIDIYINVRLLLISSCTMQIIFV